MTDAAPQRPGLVVRAAGPPDVPVVVDLYRRLSPACFSRRFMSARTEGLLATLAAIDADRGDVVLLAALAGAPDVPIAEARYVPTTDGVAEFAIVILDGHQRQGVGATLLGELLRVARTQGIVRLAALVAGDNTPMLGLAGRLGWALVEAPDHGTGLIEVSAVGGMPGWPDGDGRRRVLVEGRGWYDTAGISRLRAEGAAVRRCSGPRAGGPTCPLVVDGACRLAEGADEIVDLLPASAPECGAVRAEHARRWPERLRPGH